MAQLSDSAPAADAALPRSRRLPSVKLGTFSSLAHRDYRYLWTGTLCMSGAQWIQQITLGWLLYDLTGSSVLLGVLNGLRAAPFLVVGPVGGVIADRMDRRMLLMYGQIFLFLSALAMGVVVVTGWVQVWHIMLFAGAGGVAWAVTNPVRQALVPSLVPRSEVPNATALSQTAFNINKILGPLLGGVMIAAFGAGGNFFVQAAAFAGVLATVWLMHVPPGAPGGRRSAWGDMKDGIAYSVKNPVVLALMIVTLIPQLLAFPYQALLPVFQKDVLHEGPEALGVLLAAPGIGGIAALLLLASIANRFHQRGLLLFGSMAALGFSLSLFAVAPTLPLSAAALLIVGAAQVSYNNTTNTMLQLLVPDELRGRVMSLYMIAYGTTPLGSVIAGITTDSFGAPATVAASGLLVVALAALVAWRTPQLRGWASE